jgi:teichuronic acid biosynthesis glycosyltransferase TuaG
MFNLKNNIDIIMPNYNKGKFIKEAVQSVVNQTYKNWTLYIVDDNSNDESKRVLKKFKNNKKIRFFFLKNNKGPSYCRNLILNRSKSKFVAFLDSDDYWTKDKLKFQLKFMIKHNYPFTFTDYIPIIQNHKFKKKLDPTKIDEIFSYKKFIKNSSINTSTMILERKYIKKIRFRNLSLMEDYIFKCELMKSSNKPFKKFSKASAVYRIINESRSSKRISNLLNLWVLNKKYNNLNFFDNALSLISISLNSIRKYGFK